MKLTKFLALIIILIILSVLFFSVKSINQIKATLSPYPYGKNFAFTVTDDPDHTRLQRIKPLYNFLSEIGMRTTIAVWVKEASRTDGMPDKSEFKDFGDTCQREEYLNYIQELQKKGFEIALHTVSGGNDLREVTVDGYEEFKKLFGYYPKMNIMHSNNLENVYWGKKVLKTDFFRTVIGLLYKRGNYPYGGEDPQSPYFWGDILKEKTKYVRLWGTSSINTLKYNPSMPYHDPQKPYVNYWFSFSDGYLLPWFKKLISDENIQNLIKERGISIIYTHFAYFTKKDETGVYRLDGVFKKQIEKLAQQKDGWFVPASVILDRLLLMKNVNLFTTENTLVIVNSNISNVDGITLLMKPGEVFYNSYGNKFETNDEGEIILENLKPGEAVTLFKDKNHCFLKNEYPSRLEYIYMVLKRALILIFSHT
jgi:hypothetical protein